MIIKIPHYKTIDIKEVVLDYNGTIAKDGILLSEIKSLLSDLCKQYRVHVITADTFGTVQAQLKGTGVTVKVLESADHTQEKADFIDALGAENCVAAGNGYNDKKMLKQAALGIVLVGEEGCSLETMMSSDIVCKEITDALSLLLHPKRLIATLRR